MPPSRPRRGRFVHLRGALAALIAVFAVGVLLSYWHTRRRTAREVKPVRPLEWSVQQSAQGFALEHTVQGRPVFRVSASRAIQLRASGQATLHGVEIDIYGPDGQVSERVEGADFAYDPSSGAVRAAGAVQIELRPAMAPAGAATAEAVEAQAGGLVFNVKTGLGKIEDGLTFRYRGALGAARSADLDAHTSTLRLHGNVHVAWTEPGSPPVDLWAQDAELERTTGQVTLHGGVRVATPDERLESDGAVFWLAADYSVRHLDANGDVHIEALTGGRTINGQAKRLTADFNPPAGAAPHATAGLAGVAAAGSVMQRPPTLRALRMSGGADVIASGRGAQGHLAGDTIDVAFAAPGPGPENANQIESIAARRNALLEFTTPAPTGAAKRSIAAPEIDLSFAPAAASAGTGSGGIAAPAAATATTLQRVEAPQRSQVVVPGAGGALAALTGVAAPTATPGAGTGGNAPVRLDSDHFTLEMGDNGPREARADGEVEIAQAVSRPPGLERSAQADRLQIEFASDGSVRTTTLSGRVVVAQADGELRADTALIEAAAQRATFRAAPGSAFTAGTVQASDSRMRLRAPQLVVTRPTPADSRVVADDGAQLILLGQPSGGTFPAAAPALPGPSSEPIQVTARALQLDRPAAPGAPGGPATTTAEFTGDVRLWQGGDALSADQIGLNQARGTLNAAGNVHAEFVAVTPLASAGTTAAKNPAAPQPVAITAGQASYDSSAHTAVFQHSAVLTTAAARLTAERIELFLTPSSRSGAPAGAPAFAQPAALEKAIATGQVTIVQPGRIAHATTATYTTGNGLVVLEGGPPSISDAEHGFLSGDRLTFSTLNDAMTIESSQGTRTIGQYQVGHK